MDRAALQRAAGLLAADRVELRRQDVAPPGLAESIDLVRAVTKQRLEAGRPRVGMTYLTTEDRGGNGIVMAASVAAANARAGTVYDVEAPDVSRLMTEDETPVDNILSEKQQRLLTEPLYSSWSGPPPEKSGENRRFAVLANVGLFPSPDESPVVPDTMLSLDVTLPEDLQEKKNRSYFVWRFGKPPEVVIEIVSNREGDELGEKLRRYRRMRVSYYVVYDPLHELGELSLRVFEMRGDLYVSTERAWFESVGLGLLEWDGLFEGTAGRWLRWCTRDGRVVPTGAERAETAETRAETAETRALRLAVRLRELGIDPDSDV